MFPFISPPARTSFLILVFMCFLPACVVNSFFSLLFCARIGPALSAHVHSYLKPRSAVAQVVIMRYGSFGCSCSFGSLVWNHMKCNQINCKFFADVFVLACSVSPPCSRQTSNHWQQDDAVRAFQTQECSSTASMISEHSENIGMRSVSGQR